MISQTSFIMAVNGILRWICLFLSTEFEWLFPGTFHSSFITMDPSKKDSYWLVPEGRGSL